MKRIVGYALAVVCWPVTGAAAIVVVFIARQSVNVLWPALGGSRWTMRSFDRFVLVTAGLAWLAVAGLSLPSYLLSVVRGKDRPRQEQRWKQILQDYGLYLLLRRFLIAMGTLALLFALSWLAYQLAFYILAG